MVPSTQRIDRRHGAGGALLALLLALGGCQGEMSAAPPEVAGAPGSGGGGGTQTPPGQQDPPGEEGEPPSRERPPEEREDVPMMDGVCDRVTPGQAPLHRLTQDEYANTVRALFPELDLELQTLPGDETVGTFSANTSAALDRVGVEAYQANAERVASRVQANLDQVVGCAQIGDEELAHVEAEGLEGSVGAAQNEFYNLWSNGTLTTSVELDRGAQLRVEVRAAATQAGPDTAQMSVRIGAAAPETFEVEASRDGPQVYTTSARVDSGGIHDVVVSFDNDFYDEASGADRNLLVDWIKVTAASSVDADRACAMGYIEELAPRLWRRPLTEADLTRVRALYDGFAAEHGPAAGVRIVIEAMLQSPNFLYRIEQGVDEDEQVVALRDYELASRLSYFLWNSMPDAELFEAAAAGELRTKAGLEAQARRMIQDERARHAITDSILEMFELGEFELVTKQDDAFDPAVRDAMEVELRAFIDSVLWEGDGKLSTLLTAPYAYVSPETAPLYGVEPPASGQMERVEFPNGERAGILTQLAVLAQHGHGQVPVYRGKLVREVLLCEPIPAPPEAFEPPQTAPGQSLRTFAESRMADVKCGVCHQAMEPAGLAFERYDKLGRVVDADPHGNALSGQGALAIGFGGTLERVEVEGPAQLVSALTEQEQVPHCFARQSMRAALGRFVTDEDTCEMAVLEEAIARGGDDIREILIAVTITDAFRYRRAIEAP